MRRCTAEQVEGGASEERVSGLRGKRKIGQVVPADGAGGAGADGAGAGGVGAGGAGADEGRGGRW